MHKHFSIFCSLLCPQIHTCESLVPSHEHMGSPCIMLLFTLDSMLHTFPHCAVMHALYLVLRDVLLSWLPVQFDLDKTACLWCAPCMVKQAARRCLECQLPIVKEIWILFWFLISKLIMGTLFGRCDHIAFWLHGNFSDVGIFWVFILRHWMFTNNGNSRDTCIFFITSWLETTVFFFWPQLSFMYPKQILYAMSLVKHTSVEIRFCLHNLITLVLMLPKSSSF